MLVPTIIIDTIYSNVAAKFAFLRILKGSRHAHSHTVVGWATWLGVVGGIWIIGFMAIIFAVVLALSWAV